MGFCQPLDLKPTRCSASWKNTSIFVQPKFLLSYGWPTWSFISTLCSSTQVFKGPTPIDNPSTPSIFAGAKNLTWAHRRVRLRLGLVLGWKHRFNLTYWSTPQTLNFLLFVNHTVSQSRDYTLRTPTLRSCVASNYSLTFNFLQGEKPGIIQRYKEFPFIRFRH